MATTSGTATALAPVKAHPLETQGQVWRDIARARRHQLNLTLRQVAAATQQIAGMQDNEEFSISPGRLSQIENKGVVPNIFRRIPWQSSTKWISTKLISWFGVPRDIRSLKNATDGPPPDSSARLFAFISR